MMMAGIGRIAEILLEAHISSAKLGRRSNGPLIRHGLLGRFEA